MDVTCIPIHITLHGETRIIGTVALQVVDGEIRLAPPTSAELAEGMYDAIHGYRIAPTAA